jgi:hypothetical protein
MTRTQRVLYNICFSPGFGGEKSFGATQAVVMRNVAVDVTGAVVPGSGHWLMEENRTATVTLIRDFLKGQASAAAPAVQ